MHRPLEVQEFGHELKYGGEKKDGKLLLSDYEVIEFASVDEIVDAFRFCIDNPFVNGSLIEVNGGYCYK